MSVTASTLLLPAPDTAWRVWKPRSAAPGDTIETPSAFTDTSKPLVVGLPASACRSIGLVLPQSDDEVMEQMIIAQLEKRGIKASSAHGQTFRWHHLGATGPLAIVSVDVLADPFPEHLAVSHAADYTAALRLLQFPPGRMVLLEEQGDSILAASHQGRLFHSHIFGPQGATVDELAQEVTLAKLSLEAQQGLDPINGVTLVGNWDREIPARLSSALGLPVDLIGQLPQNTRQETAGWTPLLPTVVREAQAAETRRKKFIRHAALAVLLYGALMFLGFAWLRANEQAATKLATEVESTAPAAAAVRKAADRWKALAPAIEQNRYPLMLLNDITSLMPPSGIVIREYETKLTEIEIRGEARDAQFAFQFLEDIKKHRNLGAYDWSMAQPTVREKTAAFRAQGKLKP